MTAQHFDRTVRSEQIRGRGGNIGELGAVLFKIASEGETGAFWFVEGDTIVILESMKMEIPVVAEEPGTVTHIKVAEGDVVREGDLIAVIE